MDITSFIFSQREQAFLGGDHDAYRAQNSRRLQSLRRRLGIATPKGRKYATKPPVTADDVAKNYEYIHLLLFSSERSWATAMSMKAARVADTVNEAISGSTRQQIISRLRKATVYASSLVTIVKELKTRDSNYSQSLLEAQAYYNYLFGSYYFEKGSWEGCLRSNSVARIIYAALASNTKGEVFKNLLSETIDPSIRYAAYQLKVPRTKAISQVAIDSFPKEEVDIKATVEAMQPEAFNAQDKIAADGKVSSQAAASTITWRSRTVSIEDAAISEAIVGAETVEAQLNASNNNIDLSHLMASYDTIINARQEVVDATKTAIDELIREGVEQSDKRMQSLQITKTAANYALIEWRVGRDRVLCGADDGLRIDTRKSTDTKAKSRNKKLKRNQTRLGITLPYLRKTAALYEAILQSLVSINELSGVAGDDRLVQQLTGKVAYFRALRCLSIGRSYTIRSSLSEALALFAKAHEYSLSAVNSNKDAPSEVSPQTPKLDISTSQVRNLSSFSENLVVQYRALVDLQRISPSEEIRAGRDVPGQPIIKTLDHYPDHQIDLTNLLVYPPKIEPIPVKPLFFDLAWWHIDYPGRTPVTANGVPENKSTAPTTDEKKETRKGWFGFGR